MSFGQAVSTVLLNKYATFSGRARRSEFWWWVVFVAIVNTVASVIDRVSGLNYGDLSFAGGWIASIATIVLFIPGLAVAVRRLHDTGRTGWWLLIGLVPIVGWVVLFFFYLIDSENDNQYGPYPKD